MVPHLKHLILFAPEIMHYHESLKKTFKEKKIICDIYSTRRTPRQYEIAKKSTYLSLLSIFKVINSSKNFLICGNSTIKHIFIIFLLNFIFKKNYFLVSDSHHIIKKKNLKLFIRYLFFKLLFTNVRGIIVPGIKTKNYLRYFFINKNFFYFANYPFDFKINNKISKKKKKALNILIISRWVKEKNLNFTLNSLNVFSQIDFKFKFKFTLNIVTDKTLSFLRKNIDLNKKILLNIHRKIDRKSIYNLMKKSDILILLSTYEPWGIVIEESGLLKLPSIISKQCGASELAQKNYKGLCNLNSNHFIHLLKNFAFDKFIKRKISSWIIRPRSLNLIHKDIEKLKNHLC